MLPVCGMGDIPSGSEFPLHPFPLFRAIRAVQGFILEFSKEGSTDLGDEFADGGVANQPVGTAEWCRSLQLPDVSGLCPV